MYSIVSTRRPGQAPYDARNADLVEVSEVVPEFVGVAAFANVIDFFKQGAGKFVDNARPNQCGGIGWDSALLHRPLQRALAHRRQ